MYSDLLWPRRATGDSPFVNPVITRRNIGRSEFDGVNLSLEKRFELLGGAGIVRARLRRGDTEPTQLFDNTYQVGDNPRLDLNFGPLNTDRQQNFVLSGRVEVPHTGGLQVSGVYRYLSGAPMSSFNSTVDADRNGRLFDLLPAGNYCGVGKNSICVDNDGRRTERRDPSYKQMDTRLTYRIPAREGQDAGRELRAVQPLQHGELRQPDVGSAPYRLPDPTALRGGNGQPRAAQVGVRIGF